MSHSHFVPAAGHDWLLPLYDPLQRWLGADALHDALIDASAPLDEARVLDVGCGTGNLVLRLASAHPGARIHALDPDPKALARARAKAERAGVQLDLNEGSAEALPYEAGSFDRVFSSLMFHHLPGDIQAGMLREARRVLRSGGELHFLDFARVGAPTLLARWLHSHAGPEVESLVAQCRAAGFEDVTVLDEKRTVFGGVCQLRAR